MAVLPASGTQTYIKNNNVFNVAVWRAISVSKWLMFLCQGSGDGAVVRVLASHQYGPGSIPGPSVICGLSLLLILYSAPKDFSPGTTFPNSNSILECTDISERVLVNSLVLGG